MFSSSTVKVKLGYHGRTTGERVYVLDNQPCSLLSKRACIELSIIKRIDAVAKTSTPDFKGEFTGLFSGLGVINTSYKITTRSDACPVCIYTTRKIAHPLIPKVMAELENMQKQGAISPVTEPTS